MRAKDRITIILCVNSTGTCKVSPTVTGAAKNPRCFKNNPPCLPYLYQKMLGMTKSKTKNIADCKASNSWFMHWRWHYCVRNCVRLLGEAGDVDLPAVEQQMQQLRGSLCGYLPWNVFNMYEAGLFYRAIPNQSYLMDDEGDQRQARRGSKAMKAKECLTVFSASMLLAASRWHQLSLLQ